MRCPVSGVHLTRWPVTSADRKGPKRFWIITVGEPLPTDGRGDRLLRSGMLAEQMIARGHEVTWFTSTFDHWRKTSRTDGHAAIQVGPRFRIVFLRGRGYRANISFDRILDHRELARAFAVLAAWEPRPDLILCSLPTLELSVAAVRYGEHSGTPVVIDVRDMWPDVMLRAAPVGLRTFARWMMYPFRRMAREACRKATAITGHAPAFVEWGLVHARRHSAPFDRPFPFGYERAQLGSAAKAKGMAFWRNRGLDPKPDVLTVVFAGTLGNSFDFDAVFEAADKLRHHPVRFVICGEGDRLAALRRRGATLSNVSLPGWVGQSELYALFSMAQIGLAPYIDSDDFRKTIPNKVPEYLASSLPVALSLAQGEVARLIQDAHCGFSYDGDAARLATALVQAHRDRARLQVMARAAERLFDERFRADRVYRAMIDHLELIVHDSAANDFDGRRVGVDT